MRTFLSVALDSILPLQEFIFGQTLSLMKLNIEFLIIPIIDESPKYFQLVLNISTKKYLKFFGN